MRSRAFMILLGIVTLCVSGGAVAYGVARFDGFGLNMLLIMAGGVGFFLGGLMIWTSLADMSPQEQAEHDLEGWQAALAQGHYQQAQTIVEKALQRFPVSYTQIPGIITYLHQGQFDKAEALAQQVIRDHSRPTDKVEREIDRPILGQVHCLLAEMALFQHDFETAANHLEDAYSYQPQDDLSSHIMIKFSLYQSDLDRADLDLKAAEIRARKQGQALSPLHLALRAWGAAQRADQYGAATYIQKALNETPTRDKARRAEIHLIQGYVERSLSHPDEAHHAFEMALSCDPQGVYGSQARRELEAASA